jgi:hypothetical protein
MLFVLLELLLSSVKGGNPMYFRQLLAAVLLALTLALPTQAQDRRDYRDYPPPPPPPPRRTVDTRNFWVYGPREEFEFRKLPDGGWVQNADSGTFYFEETTRTPDYVELYDGNRGGYARLYDKRMYARGAPEDTWHYGLTGHWYR